MFSDKEKKIYERVFTVGIGGAAGDGVREAGANLAKILAKAGFEVFNSFSYPSVIRGGHNYSRISFSREKIRNDYTELDILVALNDQTVEIHKNELKKDSVVLDEKTIPYAQLVQEVKAPLIARSSAALGAIAYLLSLPIETVKDNLKEAVGEHNAPVNVALCERGYEKLDSLSFRRFEGVTYPQKIGVNEMIDGNAAFAKGLLAAGLDFYVAYPMTPSTSVLHFLAKQQKERNIKVIQPEDEIAVANMAMGIAYSGKRVAVGTATGGFALMQEAFSLAGMTETPLVFMVSQRQSPATGAATHTAQADLLFVIHSGHGEFPRIVLAPGDPEESFKMGAAALNLAWQYQMPVIVLLDKHLSESASTSFLDQSKVSIERGKLLNRPDPNYNRYQITDDGISPITFPGTPDTVVKVTSYEHDEKGIGTEKSEVIKSMFDKRFSKLGELTRDFEKYETVKVSGDPRAKNALVFWGSTKGAVLEAAKYLEKPVKLVQILWMEPFDIEKAFSSLKDTPNVINVELNYTGQLGSLLYSKTGISPNESILKFDAEPFDPVKLAEKINTRLI
jgi:2-oxoglutarate/2-oxoacid ferredoxin oxidoreductase subunit alpha